MQEKKRGEKEEKSRRKWGKEDKRKKREYEGGRKDWKGYLLDGLTVRECFTTRH